MKFEEKIFPFSAGDGFTCNVIHVTGERKPVKGPVLLVHGAGVRANIFRAPVETSIVGYLVENGYDVWLENWRSSIDFVPNNWTLDQAAVFDHPAAVETVSRETGSDKIKAIIHCQGSTSFMMSAVAGLTPKVTTIISNAVALHPVVPPWSGFKLRFTLPLLGAITKDLNPHWGVEAPTAAAKMISAMVAATHHECNNAVCKQVSFTYGSGFPALWRHENLNDETHEWLKEEFGSVPLTFFRQMARCVANGHLTSVEGHKELPKEFGVRPPETDARFVFLAGRCNKCFIPESQRRTFEYFESCRKGFHALREFEDYGHLDVFVGKNAARDTYPVILEELNRN